jgi:DNA primase large subunit
MLSVLVGLKKKRKCSFGGTRALSISVKRKRQDDAYLELMKLRKSNLGKTLNHDIETIVLSHNDPYVTRSSLNYLFKKRNTDEIPVVVETHYDFANRDIGHLEQMDITNSNVQLPMEVVNIVVNEDIVSDVSNVSSRIESMQEQNDEEQSDEMVNSVSELTSGSKSLIQRCTTIASERYVHAREKADKEMQ